MDAKDLIEELYGKYYDFLVNFCYGYIDFDPSLRDHVEDWVQDVFQSALLRALTKEKFITHPNHVGWLVQACKNRIGNAHQRNNVRRRHTAYSIDMSNAAPIELPTWDNWASGLDAKAALKCIKAILTPGEYSVMLEHYRDGLSTKEIAEKQKKTEGAVKATLRRIKKKAEKKEIHFLALFLVSFLTEHN